MGRVTHKKPCVCRVFIVKGAPAGLIAPDPEPSNPNFTVRHKKRADGALLILKLRTHARIRFQGPSATASRPIPDPGYHNPLRCFLHGCHGAKGMLTHRSSPHPLQVGGGCSYSSPKIHSNSGAQMPPDRSRGLRETARLPPQRRRTADRGQRHLEPLLFKPD